MHTCSQCGDVRADGPRCSVCGAIACTPDVKLDRERLETQGRRSIPQPNGWSRGVSRNDATAPHEAAAVPPSPTPQTTAEHSAAGDGQRRQEQPHEAGTGLDREARAGETEVAPPPPANRVAAARPPVLASEALRRELAPHDPARRSARVALVSLGLLGTIGCLALSGGSGPELALGGALFSLFLLGLPPMPYAARAGATVTLAGAGLGMASYQQLQQAGGISDVTLAASMTVLALALIFRSWHRASALARGLVALGIALCAAWVQLSGALESLTILDTHWQAWLPTVLQVPFMLVLLLSLLAFMDARSTGGCLGWAILLLLWHTAYAWSTLAIAQWPSGLPGPTAAPLGPADAAHFSSPLFAALLALGGSQMLATANSFERD